MYKKDHKRAIAEAHRTGRFILPNGTLQSMDGRVTRLNNNVIILGASGTGKTRGYVIPNILTAIGSYIVTDPKGNLYRRYGRYMRSQGYRVRRINIIHPEDSDTYNPMRYIRSSDDIMKFAHQIVYSGDGMNKGGHYDPFWDRNAEMLIAALTAYLVETDGSHEPCTVQGMIRLMPLIDAEELDNYDHCQMDDYFKRHKEAYEQEHGKPSWASAGGYLHAGAVQIPRISDGIPALVRL